MNAHPEGLTNAQYLGDGAYVGYDGYHVVLYTSNGDEYTRPVFMRPRVVIRFTDWLNDLKESFKD